MQTNNQQGNSKSKPKLKRTLPSIKNVSSNHRILELNSSASSDHLQVNQNPQHISLIDEQQQRHERDFIKERLSNSRPTIFTRRPQSQLRGHRDRQLNSSGILTGFKIEKQQKNYSGRRASIPRQNAFQSHQPNSLVTIRRTEPIFPSKEALANPIHTTSRQNNRHMRKLFEGADKNRTLYNSRQLVENRAAYSYDAVVKKMGELEEVARNLHEQISIYENEAKCFKESLRSTPTRAHKNNLETHDNSPSEYQLDSKDPKIMELELQRIKRIEKISMDNQILFSQLTSTLRSNHSHLQFEDFDEQEHQQHFLKQCHLSSKASEGNCLKTYPQQSQHIKSPFSLDDNNRSAFFRYGT